MNIQPFRVVSTALNKSLHATKLHEQTPKQPVSHNFFQKNRRNCNNLRIKRLFGLLENWVTR